MDNSPQSTIIMLTAARGGLLMSNCLVTYIEPSCYNRHDMVSVLHTLPLPANPTTHRGNVGEVKTAGKTNKPNEPDQQVNSRRNLNINNNSSRNAPSCNNYINFQKCS
jgi:hypothetical protein